MGRMYLRTDNIHPAEEGQTSGHSSLRARFRLIWVSLHMINAMFLAAVDTAHGASPRKQDLLQQTLFPDKTGHLKWMLGCHKQRSLHSLWVFPALEPCTKGLWSSYCPQGNNSPIATMWQN